MIASELKAIKKECALEMLQLYYSTHAGHIGSSLSCTDLLVYLYFERMQPQDRFLLSKGHAALALYTVLARSGRITREELHTFYQEGTLLGAHPPVSPQRPKDILFGTGSLGHGLPLAVGLALSTRFTEKLFDVYCILSDGDCNEGSTWEAALFAGHHRFAQLYVIIDNNGIQGIGRSRDILDVEPLAEKWRAFHFDVQIIEDGHDFDQIANSFSKLAGSDRPKCLIAKTIKGRGVSFMENTISWHYLPMDKIQYQQACEEILSSNA
jgi:transketolase